MPDAGLPADIDDLRAAAADADAAAAELHRLRTLAATRTARLAEALRQLGLASATQALQAVDDALIRVAEARRAGEQLAPATADAERLAGASVAAARRRDALLSSCRPCGPATVSTPPSRPS